MRGLAKEHLYIAHRENSVAMDRGKWGIDSVEVDKGGEMGASLIVSTIKIKKKYLSEFVS